MSSILPNIPEKKSSKLTKIKIVLTELVLASTSHGLPSIFRTERIFIKIMWFIFFIISSAFGCYMCTKAVLDYLSYDVVVKIRLIKEIPTEFPTITFFFNDDGNLKNYSLENRLISCYFNTKFCSSDDFEDTTDSKTGSRYFKFNGGKNKSGLRIDQKQSKLAGKSNGLSIELFIGLPEDFIYNYGLSIYVHNYTFNPFMNSEDPIQLSSGISASLKVKRTFSSKLEAPYSNCKAGLLYPESYDSSIYKYMLTSTEYKYKQNDCFDLCQSKYIIDNCDNTISLDYSWVILSNSNSTFIDCAYTNQDKFFDKNVNEYCSPFCPLECETIDYQIEHTFTQYPSYSYFDTLKNLSLVQSWYSPGYTITYDDLKKSIISINIFYDDLSYTAITEDAKMGPVDLTSNLGGLLGLFIGISFLSFGEIFEALFEIIFIIFEKNKLIN